MGNRKQPFGYRMTLGEITILPEEAELVRFIFRCYSTGATLGDLTKALCRQEIPYYAGRTWNKNMVSRILEDGRYIGEKGYPALIEPEQLRIRLRHGLSAGEQPPQPHGFVFRVPDGVVLLCRQLKEQSSGVVLIDGL